MFYIKYSCFFTPYNKIVLNLLLSFLLALACLYSPVVSAAPFYAEVAVSQVDVNVSGTNIKLITPKIKLGYIYKPKVMLEVQYVAAGDADKDNTNFKLNSIRALYLKLGSNTDIKLRIFFLLGYAETDLQTTGLSSVADVYGAISWGFVFERSVWTKNNFITFEYNSFYNNDDIGISAINLGYKYAF